MADSDFSHLYTKVIDEGGEPVELVAVMQRPGKRSWAIYDESLLRDPGKTGGKPKNRDPDIYLTERAAAGDTRVVEVESDPVWDLVDGKWRPVAAVATEDRTSNPILPTWKNVGGRWMAMWERGS